jgi:hypothetical protein
MSRKKGEGYAARNSRPLCLNNLAVSVMRFIQAHQTTTFQEMADMVCSEIVKTSDEPGIDRTTRRRVYDVLNVFLAADLIDKDGKTIRFRKVQPRLPSEIPEEDRSLAHECEERQEILASKIRLLLSYRSLVQRHSKMQRPPTAIRLPAIIVGFNTNVSNESMSAPDKKTLEISASENPRFYSPMDILQRMHFPIKPQREALQEMKGLESTERFVFREEA